MSTLEPEKEQEVQEMPKDLKEGLEWQVLTSRWTPRLCGMPMSMSKKI